MGVELFIRELFTVTKNKIIALARTELENADKKERLDDWVLEQTEKLLELVPLNFFCKWAIKKYLLPVIPTVTQAIYDMIKIRIEGI